MKITIKTIASEYDTVASVVGDVLTVDGVVYDLSSVPEGGEARPSGDHPFSGPITRTDGLLHLALIWCFDAATAEPDQGAEYPVLTVVSGDVPDPVKRKPVEELA
jgi:hypothetical protein